MVFMANSIENKNPCEICKWLDELPTTYSENKKYVIGCDNNDRFLIGFKEHSLSVSCEDLFDALRHMQQDAGDRVLQVTPTVRGCHVVLIER